MCFDKWYTIKDSHTYTFVQNKKKIATAQSFTFQLVLMSHSADKNKSIV